MRVARLAILLAAGLGVTDAVAQSTWHANLAGIGQVESFDQDPESARFQALIEGDVPLAERARLHVVAAVENDFRDALEPGRPDQSNRSHASRRWLLGDSGAAELEEFFVDGRAGAWSLRLGKQQTVWGTSDGLKVLDIVNPQSFREFILDDYERSRIPLWTVSAVRTLGDRTALDLIVIPDLTFHDIPEAGARFEITSPSLTPQADQVRTILPGVLTVPIEQRTERPELGWRTVEAGMRLRGALGGFELAICALRHFDDVPLAKLDVALDHATVTREYVRSHSFGLQANHPLGPTLVRFEGVYGTRGPIPALDLGDDGLSAVAPSYGAVVGVDLPVRDMGLVSAQVGILGHDTDHEHYDVPSRNPFATGLWRDELVANRLTAEVFGAVSLERGDAMVRARFIVLLADAVRVQVGVDAFGGTRQGVFGQFDARDRVGLELILSL